MFLVLIFNLLHFLIYFMGNHLHVVFDLKRFSHSIALVSCYRINYELVFVKLMLYLLVYLRSIVKLFLKLSYF